MGKRFKQTYRVFATYTTCVPLRVNAQAHSAVLSSHRESNKMRLQEKLV